MKIIVEDQEINIYVGKRIRAARRERHLSQVQLAKEIGSRQAAISSMEIGKMYVNAPDLLRLAIALKKPVWYFLPPVIEALDISVEDSYYEDIEVLKIFRRLMHPQSRRIAITLLNTASEIEINEHFGGDPELREQAWHELNMQEEMEESSSETDE
jgi:transcriptional regulator with XRE-family HTH domain